MVCHNLVTIGESGFSRIRSSFEIEQRDICREQWQGPTKLYVNTEQLSLCHNNLDKVSHGIILSFTPSRSHLSFRHCNFYQFSRSSPAYPPNSVPVSKM